MPWPSDRSLDGGLDQIPTPAPHGALWLCGKHLVGRDPLAALARVGAPGVIVCLNEVHELIDRYPDYVHWLTDAHGRGAVWHPIPDLHAPNLDDAAVLAADIADRVGRAEHVIVQCGAGIGLRRHDGRGRADDDGDVPGRRARPAWPRTAQWPDPKSGLNTTCSWHWSSG